jgi:hypothetical protein
MDSSSPWLHVAATHTTFYSFGLYILQAPVVSEMKIYDANKVEGKVFWRIRRG